MFEVTPMFWLNGKKGGGSKGSLYMQAHGNYSPKNSFGGVITNTSLRGKYHACNSPIPMRYMHGRMLEYQ